MKRRYRYGRSTYLKKKHFEILNFIVKFISAFRQDICETSTLSNWTEISVPNTSAQPGELISVENQSNNQR